MPNYSLPHASPEDNGPYNLLQLKEMADRGELKLEQEVLRSDMKESVTLEYALIFFDESETNDEQTTPPGSWPKLVIGAILSLVGLTLCAALVKLLLGDYSVGMRQVFLAVIFTITGGKMMLSNSQLITRKHK